MSKRKLFRSVVALVTGLLLLFSTMTVGFAATTTNTNPTVIYATSTDNKTLAFNFTDLLSAYVNGNAAYIATWTGVKSIDAVTINGVNVDYKAFLADFIANKVASLAEYAASAGAVQVAIPLQVAVVATTGTVGTVGVNPNSPVLSVASVEAINAAQLKVVFSKAVDETTSETTTNYKVDHSVTVIDAALQADGKTVILTTGALTNGTTYKVTVGTGVKDANKVALAASVDTNVVPHDVTVPSVVSVVQKGNSAVVVTFSEPISNITTLGNYKINGANPTGATPSADLMSVELAKALPQGENTLEVLTTSSLADFAGYKVPFSTTKFNVTTASTVAQAVSATVLDQSTVEVAFDQPVSLQEATNYSANFYWNANGTVGYTQYVADTANTVTKVDDKTFDVSFTGTANYLRVGSAYLVVTGVTDYFGNAVPTKVFPITTVADAAPAVSKVTAPAENTIKITFDKALNSTTVKKTNFTLKDSTGTAITLTNATYASKVVTLTFAAQAGGVYTVDMTALKSVTGNVVPDQSVTATITDLTAISSVSVGAVDSASGDYLYVKYPEAMATSGNFSILTAGKYEYAVSTDSGATYGTWTSLATGDEVLSVDSKTVKIKFAANTFDHNATTRVMVRVALVADASGNINSTQAASTGVLPVDATTNYSIAGLAVKIKDTKTLSFTVATKLTSISVADFIVNNVTSGTDIMPIDATYVNSTTANTATVTLTLGSDLDLTKTYKVSTNTSVIGTKDINDLLLGASLQTAAATNYIAPTIAWVSYQDSTHLVVDFDKNVSMVVASDFKVTDGENTIAVNAVGSTVANSGAAAVNTTVESTYVLTLASAVSTSAKLSTVASPQTEDAVANKLAVATDVAFNDFKVLSVSLADNGTAGAIATGDKIVVKFSEKVAAADLIADVNPYETAVTTATAWDGTEHTFDAGSFVSVADDAAAPGVKDTLNIAGIASINLGATDVVTANQTLTNVKVALSDDGLTLTITLGSNTAQYAAIDATKITGAKLTAANTLLAKSGTHVDTGYSVYTATKF